MPRFRYKAVNAAGDVVEGELEAGSRALVIDRLKADGHIPIRADETVRTAAVGAPRLRLRSRRITAKDIALVTRELATLLRARLPLDRALSVLRDVAPEGPVRTMVGQTQERIRGGATFAEALEAYAQFLPSYFIGMIRAGEAGGSLETVTARLAETLERAQGLRESVRSALQYPALVLIMAVVSLVILFNAVIPEFRPLFEDSAAAIPWSTQTIFALADIFDSYGWLLAVLLVLAVLAIRVHNRQPEGRLRWDRWMLATPLLGELIVKLEVARFTRVLGMLLANGVSLLNALSIATETIANRAIGDRLAGLGERLGKGESLSGALSDTGMFPILAVQLVRAGEESGDLEDMLTRVAQIYDDEVERTIQRMISLLVPLVTIGLGLVIAGIIGSILVAILGAYDLSL
jgi:general secretion pathway protein F